MTIEASGSGNYMSDGEIMAWMEQRTGELYGTMRSAMDTSENRAHLEDDLNKLKSQLAGTKNNTVTADEVSATVKDLLQKYPNDPQVTPMLQSMSDRLAALKAGVQAPSVYQGLWMQSGQSFTLDGPDADNWTNQIKDQIDAFGKEDQLSLISIQDINSQINQAKQIASNLIDGENKSASAIVANIRA